MHHCGAYIIVVILKSKLRNMQHLYACACMHACNMHGVIKLAPLIDIRIAYRSDVICVYARRSYITLQRIQLNK